MINLLKETIDVLEANGKKLSDILFIKHDPIFDWEPKVRNCKVNTELLKAILDIDYDNGYGATEINIRLKLVGKDFWLERKEYDGSEWWEYKELPIYDENIACDITEISLLED